MSRTGSGSRQRPIDPRLLRYSTAARTHLALTAGVVLVHSGATISFAWLLASGVVAAIEGEPAAVGAAAVGAAAAALVRGLLTTVVDGVAASGAARASLQLREHLMAAVERLGPGWLSSRNSAAIAVTAGHGLEALDAYFGKYLPQLVATAVATPVIVGAVWVADPLSGIILVVTLPLIPVFMVLIGLATGAVQRRQFGVLQRLASRFADTVSGLGTLKIFGRDRRAAESIGIITRDYARHTMSVLRVSFLSGFALEFLAALSVAVVAVTIGFRLLAGDMLLTTGLFVLLLAPEAFLPVRQVGAQYHAAAEGVAATDDIFAVIHAAEGRPAAEPVAGAPDDGGRRERGSVIAARGLTIARGRERIGPVDLNLRPGEILLMTGRSGAGKSSVIAALLGQVPHGGAILVDGAPAPDARPAIAWAPQRPGLIAGGIAENVALGDEAIDADLVAACVQDAMLDPSIVTVAGILGPDGDGMSGGQAQRVAVARALYRLRSGRTQARALVLDEPSSALDPVTEAALWRMLRAEADGGAAILLISHRPSALGIADRVVDLPDPQQCAPVAEPVP